MRPKLPLTTCVTLLSGLLLLTIASASLNAQSSVIISCVSKLSGVSRIVASPTACNTAVENVVMWNQQGPQGPAGSPGLVYRGAYDGSILYNKNDVITYGGSVYIALSTAGGFPPTSFLNQTSHEWGLLVPQGATGPQGIQGVPGQTGSAGPTGPQGPAGPSPVVGVHWLYTTDHLGTAESNDFYMTCPAKSLVVGAACGARDADGDEVNIIVDYAGPSNQGGQLASNPPTQARCTLSNPAGPKTAIAYAVGCLSVTTPSSSTGRSTPVFKSCTYNPDTEQPCTESDAVVTDPLAAAPAVGAALAQTASAAPITPGTTPVKTHSRKVTLWFRD